MIIELASRADLAEIERLLTASQLPTAGVAECVSHALVARDDGDGRVVGCAALEVYQRAVLLRSVAVDAAHRGRGIGQQLVEEAFVLARSKGATAAFLLTTTAADFFPRFGFEPIDRADVPDAVKQSIEFVSACPASAVVMRAPIRDHIW